MKKSPAKEVEVDLGEAGILILQYPKVLTPAQRKHTQQILEQVAATPGRQTIVLEAGVKYQVIPRQPTVINTVTVSGDGTALEGPDYVANIARAVGGPTL